MMIKLGIRILALAATSKITLWMKRSLPLRSPHLLKKLKITFLLIKSRLRHQLLAYMLRKASYLKLVIS